MSDNRALKRSGKTLPTADCRMPTESGVILIALLWILTALAVIALSFSRESFVEVAAARNAQSLETAYFVARAGIASTVYQLMEKRIMPSIMQAGFEDVPDPLELGFVTGSFGGGAYRVNVQDESGKLNINTIPEDRLRLLLAATGIEAHDADIITDSILDWRDPDNEYHLNGAEDDYYQTLNPPYRAKNGRIDTIEELLLVRGVTPEYFYGRPERAPDGSVAYKYGLSQCLTVYSTRNQVNVNYAPLAVLRSIPGLPADAAQMIYEKRRTKPFKNMQEVIKEIPMQIGAGALAYMSVEQTGIYTLTASANAENSKARRIIRAVITLDRGNVAEYKTLYWNENVPYYEGVAP